MSGDGHCDMQACRRSGETLAESQAQNPLRSAAALFVKELTWRYLVRFEPAKKPICLYASRRSGSSLLMEVVSANRRVMFSDQPFSIYTASSASINRLPVFHYGQVAFPDPDEEELLRRYIRDVLDGAVRTNVPWKLWSPSFHRRNDRICLKITDAKALIDWIDTNFIVHTVVSTRHPIAQALSVIRNGWYKTGKGFLRNPDYVERWLGPDQESYCWDLYRRGSELEQRMADYALENLPMVSLLPDRPHWLYVSYEDVVLHTVEVVEYLGDELDLPDRDAMVAQVDRPSRSSKRQSDAETRRMIRTGRRKELLEAWRSQIGADELSDCFRVLAQFGIDLYRPDSCGPAHRSIGRDGFG